MVKKYTVDQIEKLFSEINKYKIWRELWYNLAKYQRELGVSFIDNIQLDDMYNKIENTDVERIKEIEKETHHDIVAGIKHYSEQCPNASKIIHLGATSSYISDNTDLIRYRKGLIYIEEYLHQLMLSIMDFINTFNEHIIIGYTHYQKAQLTTIGKRFSVYLNSIFTDYKELDRLIDNLEFHGCRGAIGTSQSMICLFNGDNTKVEELNNKIANAFGFKKLSTVCNQTYDRKTDTLIINVLSGIVETLYKIANDIRLMQHDNVLYECFDKGQVGSSAMPYKKNPIYCERICSISRMIIVNSMNTKFNSINQWLERTLDDSANKRIIMPDLFNYTSYIVLLMSDIIKGLNVNLDNIDDIKLQIPNALTECVIIDAVKHGVDRQIIHNELKELVNIDKNDEKIKLINKIRHKHNLPDIDYKLEDLIGDSFNSFKKVINQIANYIKNSIGG